MINAFVFSSLAALFRSDIVTGHALIDLTRSKNGWCPDVIITTGLSIGQYLCAKSIPVCRVVTKHGLDSTIRTTYTRYILRTTVRVLAKILTFHRPGNLVSSPDAHLIMDTVPCLKPSKLGRRISNPKYESLIVKCMFACRICV